MYGASNHRSKMKADTVYTYRPNVLYRGFGGASSILRLLDSFYKCHHASTKSRVAPSETSTSTSSDGTHTRNHNPTPNDAHECMYWCIGRNDDPNRYRLMAACLALSCKKDSNVRAEFITNTNAVSNATCLIRNERVDPFVRECLLQCICLVIFEFGEDRMNLNLDDELKGGGDITHWKTNSGEDADVGTGTGIDINDPLRRNDKEEGGEDCAGGFATGATSESRRMEDAIDEFVAFCIDGSVMDTLVTVISTSLATATHRELEKGTAAGAWNPYLLQPSLLGLRIIFGAVGKRAHHHQQQRAGQSDIASRFLHQLHSRGTLITILSWIFFQKEESTNGINRHQIQTQSQIQMQEQMAQTSFIIQRHLCDIVRRTSHEQAAEIEMIWFHTMNEINALPELIEFVLGKYDVCHDDADGNARTQRQPKSFVSEGRVNALITDMMDTIFSSATLKSESSCGNGTEYENAKKTVILVKEILAKAYEQMTPLHKREINLGPTSFRHSISLLACILLFKKKRHRVSSIRIRRPRCSRDSHGRKQGYGQDKVLRLQQSSAMIRSLVIESGFFIQILWSLLSCQAKDDGSWCTCVERSILVLQEITSDNLLLKALHPTFSDILAVFQTGYVHVIHFVRERCRMDGKTKVVTILDCVLSSISVLFEKYISNRDDHRDAQDQGLLKICCVIRDESIRLDSLVLEEIFFLYLETLRNGGGRGQKGSIHHWFVQEMKGLLKPPWEQPETIFLITKTLMRIVKMKITAESENREKKFVSKSYGRHTMSTNSSMFQPLKRLQEVSSTLFIEVACADKITPTLLRSPPIEEIISNAPILAKKILARISGQSGTATPGSYDDNVIVSIDAPSYNAVEEYFCHLEFGTTYDAEQRMHIHTFDINLHLQLIDIAHHFGSDTLVDYYVRTVTSCEKLNCDIMGSVLQTLMKISNDEALISCIDFLLLDMKQFKSSTRFVSKQELFTSALERVLAI